MKKIGFKMFALIVCTSSFIQCTSTNTLDERIPLSSRFDVTINGKHVTVYEAPVRAEILRKEGLWSHREGYEHGLASYTMFDVAAEVEVIVTVKDGVKEVRALPESAGVVPRVSGNKVTFKMRDPAKLTLLFDESDAHVLHIWGGKPQMQGQTKTEGARRYFAPGYHEVEPMVLTSGETVEVAEGAYLKVKRRAADKTVYSDQWKVDFLSGSVFTIRRVEDVRICGRGIIDMSDIPHPGYNGINLNNSKRVRIEGVTLINAANWNILLGTSDDLEVSDVRIISARLNSDGINTVNSRNVKIEDCFVRNHDDSFVVKTTAPGASAHDIEVSRCVVWNDWGYALGISYETRSPISRVTFSDNAVVYSVNWMLGVYLSDGSTVENILFRNTTISALPAQPSEIGGKLLTSQRYLIRFGISKDVWGKDDTRGNIRNVTVDGLHIYGTEIPPSEIFGWDTEHNVQGVRFSNVTLNSKPVSTLDELSIKMNDYVSDVIIE